MASSYYNADNSNNINNNDNINKDDDENTTATNFTEDESPFIQSVRESKTYTRLSTGLGLGIISDCNYGAVRNRVTLIVTFALVALVALELISNFLKQPTESNKYLLEFVVSPPSSATIAYPLQPFSCRFMRGGEALVGKKLRVQLLPYKPFSLSVTIGEHITVLDEQVDCLSVRAEASQGKLNAVQMLQTFCNVSGYVQNYDAVTDINGVAIWRNLTMLYGPSTSYALTVQSLEHSSTNTNSQDPSSSSSSSTSSSITPIVTPAFQVVDFQPPLQLEIRDVQVSSSENSVSGNIIWQEEQNADNSVYSSSENNNSSQQRNRKKVNPPQLRCIPLSLNLLGDVRVAGVIQRRAALVHAEWDITSWTTSQYQKLDDKNLPFQQQSISISSETSLNRVDFYSMKFSLQMALKSVAETYFIGISCPGFVFFPPQKTTTNTKNTNFTAVQNYFFQPKFPINLFITAATITTGNSYDSSSSESQETTLTTLLSSSVNEGGFIYERQNFEVVASVKIHQDDVLPNNNNNNNQQNSTRKTAFRLSCMTFLLTSETTDSRNDHKGNINGNSTTSVRTPIIPSPKSLLHSQFSIPLVNRSVSDPNYYFGKTTHKFSFSIAGGVGIYRVKCYGLSQNDYYDIEVRSNTSIRYSSLTLLDPASGVALKPPFFFQATVGQNWPVVARVHVTDSLHLPLTGKTVVINSSAVNYTSSLTTDVDGYVSFSRIISVQHGLQFCGFFVDGIEIANVTVNVTMPNQYVANPPCSVQIVSDYYTDNNVLYRGLPLNISLRTLDPFGNPAPNSGVIIETDAPASIICLDSVTKDHVPCGYVQRSDRNGFLNLSKTRKSDATSGSLMDGYYAMSVGTTRNSSRMILHFTCVDDGGQLHATSSQAYDIPYVAHDVSTEIISKLSSTTHKLRMRMNLLPDVPDVIKKEIVTSNHVVLFVQRPSCSTAALGSTLPTVSFDRSLSNNNITCDGGRVENCVEQYFTISYPTICDGTYFFSLSIDGVASVLQANGFPLSDFYNNTNFYNLSLEMTGNFSDYCSQKDFFIPSNALWRKNSFGRNVCVIPLDLGKNSPGTNAGGTTSGHSSHNNYFIGDFIREPLTHQPKFHVNTFSSSSGSSPSSSVSGATIAVAVKILRSENIDTSSNKQHEIVNSGYLSKLTTASIDLNGTIIDPTKSGGIPLGISDRNGTVWFSSLTMLDGLSWCKGTSNNTVWVSICALQSWSDISVDGMACSENRDYNPFVYRFECPFVYNRTSVPNFAKRASLISELAGGSIVPGVPVTFSANLDTATLARVAVPDDDRAVVISSSSSLESSKSRSSSNNDNGANILMTRMYTPDPFQYFLVNSSMSTFDLVLSSSADKGRHRVNLYSPGAVASTVVTTDSSPTNLLWLDPTLVSPSSFSGGGTSDNNNNNNNNYNKNGAREADFAGGGTLSFKRSVFLGSTFRVAVRASIANVATPNVAILARIEPVIPVDQDDDSDSDSTSTNSLSGNNNNNNAESSTFKDPDQCNLPGAGCGLLEGQTVSVTDSNGIAEFILAVKAATPNRYRLRFSATASGNGLFAALSHRSDTALSKLVGHSAFHDFTASKFNEDDDEENNNNNKKNSPINGGGNHFAELIRTLSSATSGAFKQFSSLLGPITSKFFLETTTNSFYVKSAVNKVTSCSSSSSTTMLDGFPPMKPSSPPQANVTDSQGRPMHHIPVEIVFQPSHGIEAVGTFATTNSEGIATFDNFQIIDGSAGNTYLGYFDALGVISTTSSISSSSSSQQKTSTTATTTKNSKPQFVLIAKIQEEVLSSLQTEMRNTALIAVLVTIPVLIASLPRTSIWWLLISIVGSFSFLIAFVVLEAVEGSNQTGAKMTFRITRILLVATLLGSLLFTFWQIFRKDAKHYLIEIPSERAARIIGYVKWLTNYRRDMSLTSERYRQQLNDEIKSSFAWRAQRAINKVIHRVARVHFVFLHRADENLPPGRLPEPPSEIDINYIPLKYLIALGIATVLFIGVIVLSVNATALIRAGIDHLILIFPAPSSDSDSTNSLFSNPKNKRSAAETANTVKNTVVELMALAAQVQPKLTFLTTWASALESLDSFTILDQISVFLRTTRKAFLTAEIVAHLLAISSFFLSAYFIHQAIQKLLVESRRGQHREMRLCCSIAGSDGLIGAQSLVFAFQHQMIFWTVILVIVLLSVPFVANFIWYTLLLPFLVAYGITLLQRYIIDFIADRFIVRGLTILNPFLYSIYTIYLNVVNLAFGLVSVVRRFFYGLLYTLFFFSRSDWGIVPKQAQDAFEVDGAYSSFMSLIASENAINHPIFLCAAAELLILGRLRQMQRVDENSSPISYSSPSSDIDSITSPTSNNSATKVVNVNNNNVNFEQQQEEENVSPFGKASEAVSQIFGRVTIRGGRIDAEEFASYCSIPQLASIVELRMREKILDWKVRCSTINMNYINSSQQEKSSSATVASSSQFSNPASPLAEELLEISYGGSESSNNTNKFSASPKTHLAEQQQQKQAASAATATNNATSSTTTFIPSGKQQRTVSRKIIQRFRLWILLSQNPSLMKERKFRLAGGSMASFTISPTTSDSTFDDGDAESNYQMKPSNVSFAAAHSSSDGRKTTSQNSISISLLGGDQKKENSNEPLLNSESETKYS